MKTQMQFLLKRVSLSIIMIVLPFMAVHADEGESQEIGFRCYQDGQEIFRSDSSDISVFDAAGRGLQQISVQDVPDKGVRVYVFQPGMVVCSLRTNSVSE